MQSRLEVQNTQSTPRRDGSSDRGLLSKERDKRGGMRDLKGCNSKLRLVFRLSKRACLYWLAPGIRQAWQRLPRAEIIPGGRCLRSTVGPSGPTLPCFTKHSSLAGLSNRYETSKEVPRRRLRVCDCWGPGATPPPTSDKLYVMSTPYSSHHTSASVPNNQPGGAGRLVRRFMRS